MTDKNKINEGPTCACGRVDIYEEMLKNQNNKEEVTDSTDTCQIADINNSADNAEGEDQKGEQTNK